MTTPTDIQLRPCRPDEWAVLQALGRRTFSDAFAARNTPENLRTYLDTAFQSERLQAELANPASQFWLALEGDQAVGYLKVNLGAAQTEQQNEPSLEIERIYVRQDLQRAGVGQLLFDQALAIARSAGAGYLWLGVWEHNPKAIQFYEKNGMRTFGQHTFYLGEEVQTDLLMKVAL